MRPTKPGMTANVRIGTSTVTAAEMARWGSSLVAAGGGGSAVAGVTGEVVSSSNGRCCCCCCCCCAVPGRDECRESVVGLRLLLLLAITKCGGPAAPRGMGCQDGFLVVVADAVEAVEVPDGGGGRGRRPGRCCRCADCCPCRYRCCGRERHEVLDRIKEARLDLGNGLLRGGEVGAVGVDVGERRRGEALGLGKGGEDVVWGLCGVKRRRKHGEGRGATHYTGQA